jgi:hypothetical protein
MAPRSMNPQFCSRCLTDAERRILRRARSSSRELGVPGVGGHQFSLSELALMRSPKWWRISPRVYYELVTSGVFYDLCSVQREELHKQAERSAAMALWLRKWRAIAVNLLRAKGIPVILLKGAAFDGTLYVSKGPRLGSDIDLLVRARDFAQARAVMAGEMQPKVGGGGGNRDGMFAYAFVSKGIPGPEVDLHRDLTHSELFCVDSEMLWSRSQPHAAFADPEVRWLATEDNLVHLAVHAARELNFCTHHLLDAHELICQRGLDVEKLALACGEGGVRLALYGLLRACADVLDTPLSPNVLTRFFPGRARASLFWSVANSERYTLSGRVRLVHRVRQIVSHWLFSRSFRDGLRFQLGYVKARMKSFWRKKSPS